MVTKKEGIRTTSGNSSKLNSQRPADLKNRTSKQVFGNMMVDVAAQGSQAERNEVRKLLENEFGDQRGFSDNFIDLVLQRLKGHQ